jgi:nitrogen fixation NifU-like protein
MEIGQEMYSELLLDLYRHPLNKKQLADFDINSVEFNPLCGDKVELFLKFDASDRLEAIGYQGEGCAISQAATSLLTEHVKGKTKQEIQALTGETLLDLLGLKNLNPTRMRCALLGLAAVQKALKIQK